MTAVLLPVPRIWLVLLGKKLKCLYHSR